MDTTWADIDTLMTIWKYDISDKLKREIFQAVDV